MDFESREYFSHKIKTADEIAKILGKRPRKKKAIMCHGTFDVVHPGHIRHLLYAKTKAEILIASLTADIFIKKGNLRPYVPEDLRAINLAALEMVDLVLIDRNETPLNNLGIIKPDYFAKGYEYTAENIQPKTQDEIGVLDSYGGEMIFTPGDIVYSSSSLIELAPPSIGIEKLITVMKAENVSFADLRNVLNKFADIKIHVVGDTIVDSHTYCSMTGGMTKTPTISVRFENKTDFVGGAGVVAKHLSAAGSDVTFSTILGDDEIGKFTQEDLEKAGVKSLPIVDCTRPTTNKNAIIVQGYRMLKVDTVDNRSISDKVLSKIRNQISDLKTDAVAFCDFRHGIFNRSTIAQLTKAIPVGAFKVADSQVASRWGNILDFQDFDLITPNEREARFALGDQDSIIRPLAMELHSRSRCKTLMLKCGDRGLITYRSNEVDYRAFISIESFADHIVDSVGAGDALLAYATLAMVATGNEVLASILGNMAAGIECECEGNRPVTPDQIRDRINSVEKQVRYA